MRSVTLLFCIVFGVFAGLVTVTVVAAAANEQFDVNLLRNPGFEDGFSRPTGWDWIDADWALRDARAPYAGDVSALLFAADEEREMLWVQGGVPLLAGGRYVLAGNVRADAPAVAVLGVGWEAEGRGGQRLHRGILADVQWQRVELEFVATDTAPAAVSVGGIVHGSVWWDDVSLKRIDDRAQKLAEHWEALIEKHGDVYTGLIVDARGLGLQRGMSPKIVDERGHVLYAGLDADRSTIMGRGLVSYMSDPNEALKHSRLAVNEHFPYTVPLIVPATALVDDPFRASVVISVADTARIRRELAKYDFLGRHAVVFLVGDEK